jgi:hypothetical protein
MGGPKIPGGYILISRKIIESEIWEKPPLYVKVWLYLLTLAQHSQYKGLKRGQLRTSIPEIIEACSWKVGYRKEKPTKDQIYQIIDWLRKGNEAVHEGETSATMITTTKATQGLIITIDNYDFYQCSKNYESNDEGNNEEEAKATRKQRQPDNINKNDKNVKNDNVESHKLVYDETSIYFQLADFFYQQILENNPNHKKPNYQKWSNDIRLMMDKDNRTEEQIRYLMKWVQQNEFEMANVLSPDKLRKRFDQLVLEVKREKEKKVTPLEAKREPKRNNEHNEKMKKLHGG